ncbi:MAG: thymidine phosphorylase [Candidatus Komeilibacteria bacterium]|nr:thymidine phosphorylase [Candidatus Komeilibacteria bacterium]
MALYLKVKKLDLSTGKQQLIALFNEEEANNFGIQAGDKISLTWRSNKTINVEVNLTEKYLKPGFIGLYEDIWKKYSVDMNEIMEVHLLSRPDSILAIKKKLFGKKLNYQEIYSIMKDITDNRLTNVGITYFVAASFLYPYTNEELYFMAKAIAETGEILKFGSGMVVDKHSVGGLAGNRTTMIAVPIIASLGLKIPKTSSRAITSPAGTADTMEVLSPVSFSAEEMREIVKKTNGCLIWGGGFNLAPADDKILKVTYPLSLEPYDKMIVSIMAKKIAASVTHLVIDMPIGPTTKIPDQKTAFEIKEKFEYIAKKYGIKIKVIITASSDPVGKGIGPALEARDVLRVLQQKANRPLDLEDKGLMMAGELLELAGRARKGWGKKIATDQLVSGAAWKKMAEIIKAQGGKADIDSETVTLGAIKFYVDSDRGGKITMINNKKVNDICRILGAPADKLGGIYLNKEIGNSVAKGERLFTMYARNDARMALAKEAIKKINVFEY